MGNKTEERAVDTKKSKSVVIGLLIGGLAGAAAMLLFAPQSGKQTRAKIQRKSIQWRDQITDFVKNTLVHFRSDTREVTAGIR